jgi:hypothetical protein
MRKEQIAMIASIFAMIAQRARHEYEFTQLHNAARCLEKFRRLPGENGTRGRVRKQINRTEEMIAILLGLEESIVNLGRYYRDIPRLEALGQALDIVTPCLNAARHIRGRLAG